MHVAPNPSKLDLPFSRYRRASGNRVIIYGQPRSHNPRILRLLLSPTGKKVFAWLLTLVDRFKSLCAAQRQSRAKSKPSEGHPALP